MFYVKNYKNTKNVYDYIYYENNDHPYGIKIYKDNSKNYIENVYKLKILEKIKLYNINNKKSLDDLINNYGVNNTINWSKLYKKYDGLMIDNYDKIVINLLKSKYLKELFNNSKIINKYEWFINNNSNSGYLWNFKKIRII